MRRPSYPSEPDWNFLGLGRRLSEFETSRYLILPVPYDATTSYRSGARYGPEAIIASSRFMEFYDEELGFEPCRAGIHTLPPLDVDTSGVEATVGRIFRAARSALASGKTLVTLGGDHSISPPLVRAHAARYRDLHVLQFDAHSDLRDSYMGSRFNHACAARRMGEFAGVTGVGIRSMTPQCAALVKSGGPFSMFTAGDIRADAGWIDRVVDALGEPVYVTIDLDAFDPSVVPSTGTPEPGGLLWHDVTALLREVARRRRVVGADIVELSPIPGLHAPDFLAARLVYKLIGYMEDARRDRARGRSSVRK
ncbi:MAG: agmatinase [Acidobacteriota bacterium]